MAFSNPCAVMQALMSWELNAIKLLNKKFAALRRLAELIEQLGDISTLLPNISALIPVGDLDISLYTDLQVNCPFLGLPPFDNQSLSALKGKVNAAYGQLARLLANHPWSRLDKIQGMLNEYQNKINYPYGEDYIRCLNAVCNAIGTAGSLLESAKKLDVEKELSLFGKNFVQNAGSVLTEPMKIKRDEAVGVYNSVLDLKDESVQDFQTIQNGIVVPNKSPLRLGTPTGIKYSFDATQMQRVGFPPSLTNSGSGNVGSVIPSS